MPAKPTTIDDYLAAVPVDQRAVLERLRKTIRAAVPQAEECLNYGVPAFRVGDKTVAGFGASKNHCSFYPMSGKVVSVLRTDLAGFETTKGSIHFTAAKPLPAALVRKLIEARLGEIAAKPPRSTKAVGTTRKSARKPKLPGRTKKRRQSG